MKRELVVRSSVWLRSLLFFAAMGAWFGLSAPAFGAADPRPCPANPENRQLDYWLGNWTITNPDGAGSGSSKVYLRSTSACWSRAGTMAKVTPAKTCSPTARTIRAGTECSRITRVGCTCLLTDGSRRAPPSFMVPVADPMGKRFSIESGWSAWQRTKSSKHGRNQRTTA
jgi:hypothetical protein